MAYLLYVLLVNLCGFVFAYHDPWFSSWVLRINSYGDSLWYREYHFVSGEYSENRFYDISPTMDNGFIAGGFVKPITLDTGIQRAWIVKIGIYLVVLRNEKRILCSRKLIVIR